MQRLEIQVQPDVGEVAEHRRQVGRVDLGLGAGDLDELGVPESGHLRAGELVSRDVQAAVAEPFGLLERQHGHRGDVFRCDQVQFQGRRDRQGHRTVVAHEGRRAQHGPLWMVGGQVPFDLRLGVEMRDAGGAVGVGGGREDDVRDVPCRVDRRFALSHFAAAAQRGHQEQAVDARERRAERGRVVEVAVDVVGVPRVAGDAADVVAAFGQEPGDGAALGAGRAGDCDFHGVSILEM